MSVWDSFDDVDTDADVTAGIAIADDLRAMVRDYEARSPRSLQADLGPSQIGMECVRCLARLTLGVGGTERAYADPWCRIIGTATHAWLDDAAEYANGAYELPRWLPEHRVYPDVELLPSGGRCDLFDVSRRTVIDHKVVGAAPQRKYRANGPSSQYRAQGHLYGLGYANLGYAVDRVAIAFWLRGGRLSDLYVWTEAYDETLAIKALEQYRTIRDIARTIGPAVLDLLPVDADCFECGGIDALNNTSSSESASGSAA